MIKLLICPIFILIGGYIGFLISKTYQNRIKQLELCDLLFQRIKVYLEYEKTPTKLLIKSLSKNETFKELNFLKICSDKLKNNINFSQAWNESLDQAKKDISISLTNEDYDILKQFGDILGAYEAKAQNNGIAMLQEMIKIQQNDAIEQNKTMGKLYRSLGVLGGISVVILIL